MSRLLAEPAPVTMEVAETVPARLSIGHRQHKVEKVLARWRLETDWWRAPLSREYWKLWLSGDLVCEVYRDCLGGGWWLTRWYD